VYYRYLGKNIVIPHDEKFWKYHERKLKECGFGFSLPRLTQGALEVLWNATLTPVNSLGKGLKLLKLKS
jgi:hypothetical protein